MNGKDAKDEKVTEVAGGGGETKSGGVESGETRTEESGIATVRGGVAEEKQPPPFEGGEICLGTRRIHRDLSTTALLLDTGDPISIMLKKGSTAAEARQQMELDGLVGEGEDAVAALRTGFTFITKKGGFLKPRQEATRVVEDLFVGPFEDEDYILTVHAHAGAADGKISSL